MPSFQGRVSKLIISSISNRSQPSSSLIKLRCFSSDTDRRRREMSPPEPIPNRPLRGQRPSNPQPNFERRRESPPNLERKRENPSPPLQDSSFLEKLKMGLEKSKKEKPQEAVESPPEEANEIFKKMKETGLIPNAVAMLDGLCKDGLVQEAMKLFGSMREKGTIPEVVIYTAVVEGFCKAQKPEDAKRIFRKMQSNGIIPNAFSYNVVVQGLCRCGDMEEAAEFCGEMLEAGHSPNVATFVGLVDGVCKENGVEGGENVIGKLKQTGFVVNEKAVREFLDKRASFSPVVWEAIFGKNHSKKIF
ncbi:pentatricopeptide repeat-containing protein At4g38150-like [Argentina anserina]|uniref:pentatricopeptide repeat-containing protein At4g38150-like n=1 Tax=Argentina anserina TaxID=57926 RepID=UPI00217664FB|nr:pentatricopeptide repeat-containing protein At4g38150-like [Potentilla anserina]